MTKAFAPDKVTTNVKDSPRPGGSEKFVSNSLRTTTSSGFPDQYGHLVDDTVAIDWKDATSGTVIYSPGSYVDDDVTGPIPLPAGIAPFQFYENQYTEVYVGSNGLLGFNSSIMHDGASLENLPIPLDYEHPQAFLAPFWDDLLLGGGYNTGGVYWDTNQDVLGKYFVVEWHEVSRVFSNDLLTFEVVLYENGTILFQYLSVSGDLGSCTIGIEDGDGVDGIQYAYNGYGSAPASGKAIRFSPPGPGFRAKAFPLNQGILHTGAKSSLDIYIRNTGDMGNDTYNLDVTSSEPGWKVDFLDRKGFIYLSDTTSGDGLPDTGALDVGETLTVTVEIQSPFGAAVGDGTNLTINIASDNDPSQELDLQITTIVPAPFALIYREKQKIFTDLVSTADTYSSVQHPEFRGSTFAISALSAGNFISLWEHNELGTSYANIYFTLVSSTGLILNNQPFKLTDNTDPNRDVRDFSPVVATASNGNIAVAWVRIKMGLDVNDPGTYLMGNQNVYLTILNPTGSQIVLPETMVTNQTGWYASYDDDIQQFENLSLSASSDGKFHLAWVEKHILLGQTSTDIAHAVYSATDGSVIQPQAMLTSGDPNDDFDYLYPSLTAFTNSSGQPRVLIFYFIQDNTNQGNPVLQLVSSVLNPDGSIDISPILLHTGVGYGSDADQLSDGRVAVAWTDTTTESERVAYLILNQDLTVPAPVQYFYNPDGRPSGIVSVTHDDVGNAIFTWMDSKWAQRIYYASVEAGGEVAGPLAFIYAEPGGVSNLQTSFGLGNAHYAPWYRYFFAPIFK